ncbi:MAG TPA: 3D domain-containing protein [Pyrinomonadaceae bacterium]|nr:3D domain-containing protein [Pyrinomonadaceae bacterium]
MKILAGGSVFLGTVALFTTLFYFQPTVEAAALAIDSQNNQQQLNNQDNKLIQQSEQTQVQTSKDNSDDKNRELLEAVAFKATAYCLKGRTANGGNVRRGIVAADPRVLPLGSRIQVNAGAYSGTYTVADTGGAVKGRKLDIWMPSCTEAVRFGSRKVSVSRMGRKG